MGKIISKLTHESGCIVKCLFKIILLLSACLVFPRLCSFLNVRYQYPSSSKLEVVATYPSGTAGDQIYLFFYRRIRAKVYLGAHNISRTEESQVIYNVISTSFKIHPHADIGLIELPESAPINAYIKTVELPAKSDVDKDYSYKIGKAHGWGVIQDEPLLVANVLYTVSVMVSPQSQCVGGSDEICTSGNGGKGTCNGDSGGPLVVEDEQIGITAWGSEKCEIGYPSVYTSVNKYLSWIENNSDVKIKQLI